MRPLYAICLATVCALPALAQGVSREEIRRVPVPGSLTMEVVVSRLTVDPAATIPLHTHAGDEHAVEITETTARAPNGNMVQFPIGATLYFPEGEVHGGLTNIAEAPMVAITTSVVQVGQPFTTPAE